MREVMKWVYKEKDGNVIGHVIRLEAEKEFGDSQSRKQIIPYFKENGQAGIPEGLPAHHRIYGMDTIKDFSKPVFIVEGEKCAYALHGLGYQAIANLGGCAQAHLADWSVIRHAKNIYILPDNDTVGEKLAKGIYNRIKIYGAKISIVKMSDIPKGDLSDFLKSLPELSNWNELDSLKNNNYLTVIKESFNNYINKNAEDIPAAWKFIITLNKHKLISLNDFKRLKLPKRHMLLFPWAPIQEWAIQHRKKGRSLVFIHHANKEGKQRGSHKKEDVMDAVLKLKRPDDYIQGEGSTKLMVQYTKARHLSGDMAQDIEATLCSDGEFLKWEWEQGDILYRKAVEMIKTHVPMRNIAEELGLGKSTIHRWKTKAQSEGLL